MQVSRIYSVDSVALTLMKKNPPDLLIEASGHTASSGWKNGQLLRIHYPLPPADGIQDLDFVAELPASGDITLPKLTQLSAELTIPSIDIANYWGEGQPLLGIRCHALSNKKEQTLKE